MQTVKPRAYWIRPFAPGIAPYWHVTHPLVQVALSTEHAPVQAAEVLLRMFVLPAQICKL